MMNRLGGLACFTLCWCVRQWVNLVCVHAVIKDKM